jgi:multidrug efflux pump
MTLSDLSVRRPVFATVMAVILCVVGIAAFFLLPVRELPNVDPPQVSIQTNYRGASAEVVEERITEVIERQVSSIEGIDRVQSQSRDGRSNINITFLLNRKLDDAANDVRDAVSRVVGQLPTEVDPPQIAKADADANPVLVIGMSSPGMNRLEIADYADRYLVERFATVPGVAQVGMFGQQFYSMRVWLDADAMATRGLTVADVESAIRSQNVELPAGGLESTDKDYTIRVKRGYVKPEEFAQLPVSTNRSAAADAAPEYVTRLGDIARVEEGPDEPRRLFRRNGLDMVGMGLTRQSNANDLEISDEVKKTMAEVAPTLPKGFKLEIIRDDSDFTRESIHEVWFTMGLSVILVALVNFIFLGSWRSALIPSIVAPISVLATFTVLAAFGFSINLLTLLALVLAIGLVVDDAIVVVENIQRRLDEGEEPLIAAERGAKQVFFAVLATTVVLMAVFAPLMFLPGYIGRLFVELAVTVSAAVGFSALLALSLSPMLSSKLLRPAKSEGWLAKTVDAAMTRLKDSYQASLSFLLSAKPTPFVVIPGVLLLGALAGLLYVTLPQDLVPREDRGRIDLQIQPPEGAGYEYTLKAALAAAVPLEQYRKQGVIDNQTVVVNIGQGQGFVNLTSWKTRSITADDVAADLNGKFANITAARVTASVPSPISRGNNGGNQINFVATGPEYADLARWLQPILRAAQQNPGLARPRLNYEPTSPRMVVDIDRDKAATMGVSPQAVGDALQTMFGSKKVTTYVRGGKEYDVILQTALDHRGKQQDLDTLYVRAGSGEQVPLASVVKTEVVGDSPARRRIDRQRQVALIAQLQPGYTTAEAIDFFKAEAAKQPPGNYTWDGQARDYLEASGAVGVAFAFALVLVFLVLAAQFESFIHPAAIMLTVPLAALGGLFGLLMAGSSVNIYSQVGLIILVGISAKNGILIVEFANQLRDQGRSIQEAVIEAASLRLRPIIMTSVAAAAGAMPLVMAAGPGAGSRQTIGVVIVSGAMFGSLMTLFVLPIFYNLVARFTRSPEWTTRRIEEFKAREQNAGQEAPHPAE